jgi:hypothetical protein
MVPGDLSEYPILTRNRYGLGTAWYVAGAAGYAAFVTGYYRTMELVAGFIDSTGVSRLMTVDAPSTVDVSVERDRDGFLYVHLANKTTPPYVPGTQLSRSIDQVIPVADIRLGFPTQGTAECVSPANGELIVAPTDAGVECLIPRLSDYCLIKVRLV